MDATLLPLNQPESIQTPTPSSSLNRELAIQQVLPLSGQKRKSSSNAGLDGLFSQLKQKKSSVLDSSEQQWKSFKAEEGIEDELSQNKKDGYLGKVAFLSRVDIREHDKFLSNKRTKKY